MKNGVEDPGGDQQPLMDVQMKCGSDSELWVCDVDVPPSQSDRENRRDLKKKTPCESKTHAETMDIERDYTFDGPSVYVARPCEFPSEGSLSQMLDSSSERPPGSCHLGTPSKRKLCLSGAEVKDLGQRKRQCVDPEDLLEGGVSM